MKRDIWAGVFLVSVATLRAGENSVAVGADQPKGRQTEQAVDKVDDVARSSKAEIVVGETCQIKLKCNPTTGYNWELKSIDRKIAVPTGEVEFRQSPAKPGMVGVGGSCVLGLKGVNPGKTKAILVYRRSWEKGEPAETYTAEIKVLPKKKS